MCRHHQWQQQYRHAHHNISSIAAHTDTFTDFPSSLLSVGHISTKDGVTVYNDQDVLITCLGKPILIRVHKQHGWYHIPFIQQLGQWQPQPPRPHVAAALQKANSVYDLPSIKQAIHWMNAVCGYPINPLGSKPSAQEVS